MLVIDNVFDPVALSIPENEFLLKHLGEPWSIASKDIHPRPHPNPSRKEKNPVVYPDGVVPAAVRPVIDRIYELIDLEKNHGEPWVGLDAVKTAIRIYIEQSEKWKRDKKRGAPRFPSMHAFDSKGRPFKAGPGSDSGRVTTYLTSTGKRELLAIELVPTAKDRWVADWAQGAGREQNAQDSDIKVDDTNNRIECFCGHTESFKKDVRSSYNAARSRMSKHLRNAKEEVQRHREAHTTNFGSPTLEN